MRKEEQAWTWGTVRRAQRPVPIEEVGSQRWWGNEKGMGPWENANSTDAAVQTGKRLEGRRATANSARSRLRCENEGLREVAITLPELRGTRT